MNKLKSIFYILIVVFFYSCYKKNETEKKVNSNKVEIEKDTATEKFLPQSFKEEVKIIGENIKIFVPENYAVLDTVSGNLNLDNFVDVILVLKKIGEEKTSDVIENPEKRPLLILIGEANNKYKLAERNDNTVYCIDCGGIMGDPFMEIVIKNGYFSVEHYGGSAWRWTRVITYKYSKEDNNWYLHKYGGESFHATEPEKVEKSIKTTKDFGKVLFKDFDIYADEEE